MKNVRVYCNFTTGEVITFTHWTRKARNEKMRKLDLPSHWVDCTRKFAGYYFTGEGK